MPKAPNLRPWGSPMPLAKHQPPTPGRPLVIFSAPPSAHLLRLLHDQHQPSAIYLVGQLTNEDSVDAVIRTVAGMCKYALQRGQPLQLDRMAARLGVTTHIVRHSLLWLQAKSQISLQGWEKDGRVQISNPHPSETDNGDLDCHGLASCTTYRTTRRSARLSSLFPARQASRVGAAHCLAHR